MVLEIWEPSESSGEVPEERSQGSAGKTVTGLTAAGFTDHLGIHSMTTCITLQNLSLQLTDDNRIILP